MTKSNFSIYDSFNSSLLMELHLKLKGSLLHLREAIEQEEVKGLFPTLKRKKLYELYEEKLKMLYEIEAKLIRLCPSLDELYNR